MTTNDRIDELEAALYEKCEPVDCPVSDYFIPGFYIRKIFMPAGKDGKETIVTSRVHLTEHPFYVSKGKAYVMVNNGDWELIEAPYAGVTFPNTKRVLHIIEDMEFCTFHPILPEEQPSYMLEEEVSESLDKIEKRITLQKENPLLGGIVKNNELVKTIENY